MQLIHYIEDFKQKPVGKERISY